MDSTMRASLTRLGVVPMIQEAAIELLEQLVDHGYDRIEVVTAEEVIVR